MGGTLPGAEREPWKSPGVPVEVPEPRREFRGIWLTTVYNLDWPSKPSLPVEIQQLELREILDRVASLNMNAVVLQVRTMCDALYDSPIEPWSYFLTGEVGKAPEPYYDPLKYAVDEAHARGLELHAWFNPFRAATAAYGEAGLSADHVGRQYPWLLRPVGGHQWLDPSSEFVRNRAATVVFDVVNRYDIDAVHMDDYFYPYPEGGREPGLDDAENYQRYLLEGGTLSLGDWRREIVNEFVRDLYVEIKRSKPWVKFGLSPFGIWRPKHPESIDGLDAWRVIFADSRKWINEGWVDYLSPQLYWKREGPQSFTKLFHWWQDQNPKGRHLWPGVAASRIGKEGAGEADGRDVMEVLEQIDDTRAYLGSAPASGQLHWRWEAFATNRGGIAKLITLRRYAERAVPPPSPWLAGQGDADGDSPLPVAENPSLEKRETLSDQLEAGSDAGQWILAWETPRAKDTAPVRWWVVQARHVRSGDAKETEKPVWTTLKLVPGAAREAALGGEIGGYDALSVRPLDAIGELGFPTVLEKTASGKKR